MHIICLIFYLLLSVMKSCSYPVISSNEKLKYSVVCRLVYNVCRTRENMATNPSPSLHMSLVMRKPDFCICENKDADQLRGNREADQRLCFRFTDSTFPLLPKYKISSL